jgi:glyoxylase-like metal-dependent hydrolase (beta-lactamase superfamily II)
MGAAPIENAPGFAGVRRIIASNPGPMTLEGTNTYVVSTADGAYVIDPGPADEAHLHAVREAAEGEITGILLTHSHSDHSAGSPLLDAPLLWGEISSGNEANVFQTAASAGGGAGGDHPRGEPSPQGMGGPLPRQDPPTADVGPFTVLPTPGHASDHVCFVHGALVFCGDLILGHGSSIVPPRAGGGSLAEYMSSLRRLAELEATLLAPGHGPWITEPAAKIAEYTEHRLDRERQLVAALDAGERSRSQLLAAVWDDVPEPLRPAAAVAMQAHVEKLEEEGRLVADELRD